MNPTGWGTLPDVQASKPEQPQAQEFLTPGEVAALFRVDAKTVTRWASAGRLSSIRTPGGHHRFRRAEVMAFLEGTDPN